MLDDTVKTISSAPATALEIARVVRMSPAHYRLAESIQPRAQDSHCLKAPLWSVVIPEIPHR